jgi:protein involved in polysaccharide export with SLBB domain
MVALTCCLSGCASLTNPVADATPVRLVPPPLLGGHRTGQQTIPLTLLGQCPPPAYALAPGDVLGVYIEGILGEATQPLPVQAAPMVQIREQRRLQPAAGYPVPVLADGTLALPWIERLKVRGLSLADAQEAIQKAYVDKQLIRANTPLLVTLMNPRQYHVVVMRQESGNITLGPGGEIGGGKRGTGHLADLLAYENDVLHALADTGGLPGLDAYDEVVIFRGCFKDEKGRAGVMRMLDQIPHPGKESTPPIPCAQAIHIPLRLPPGQPMPFGPDDVILETGDVVFLEARDYDLFYTGGLLPGGEHVLPRDRDLDVVEAVAQVRGPLFNGAFGTNSLAGNLIQTGVGGPSPSLLVVVRRTPGGGQVAIRVDLNRAMRDARERIVVQPGDFLVLQETPGEALARYFQQSLFNFDFLWTPIRGQRTNGVIDVASPDRLPPGSGTVQFIPAR